MATTAAALLAALAVDPGCASRPASGPAAVDPHGSAVVALNHVASGLELQRIQVVIDGTPIGSLSGDDVGGRFDEPLPIGRTMLAQGRHSITVLARAADRDEKVVLALTTTQEFEVGRQPVRVVTAVSAPGASPDTRRLRVDFEVEGGTLAAPVGHFAGVGSATLGCEAMSPVATALCETQAALRAALADHDAPRVVCIDDALHEMRSLAAYLAPPDDSTASPPSSAAIAVRHEGRVAQDVEFRVITLAQRARKCQSANVINPR